VLSHEYWIRNNYPRNDGSWGDGVRSRDYVEFDAQEGDRFVWICAFLHGHCHMVHGGVQFPDADI